MFGYGPLGRAALGVCDRLAITPAAIVVPSNRHGADVEMVAAGARDRGWPVLSQPARKQIAPFLDTVRALAPDVLLVWSYPMVLPAGLIAIPAKGAFNLHSGKLPGYRGGHTMNWALINGETETAVTLHHLDAGIDTGPVVDEQPFAIEWRDDVVSVHRKLETAGESLLMKWWPAIEQGIAPATVQDESRAVYFPMRTAADGLIDWRRSNIEIYNLVRALVSPWPGAFTFAGETKLVLRRVEPAGTSTPEPPGTVIAGGPGLFRVATGAGDLDVLAMDVDDRAVAPADLARLVLPRVLASHA